MAFHGPQEEIRKVKPTKRFKSFHKADGDLLQVVPAINIGSAAVAEVDENRAASSGDEATGKLYQL